MRNVAGIAVEDQYGKRRVLCRDKPAMQGYAVAGFDSDVLVWEPDIQRRSAERTARQIRQVKHAALHEINQQHDHQVSN